MVRHERAPVPHPEQQRRQAGFHFFHRTDLVPDLARAPEDIHAAGRNIRIYQSPVQAPKRVRGQTGHGRIVPAGSLAEHNFGFAGAHPVQKLQNQLRRFLKIGRQGRAIIAAGMGQARANRREGSEIAAQPDQLDAHRELPVRESPSPPWLHPDPDSRRPRTPTPSPPARDRRRGSISLNNSGRFGSLLYNGITMDKRSLSRNPKSVT